MQSYCEVVLILEENLSKKLAFSSTGNEMFGMFKFFLIFSLIPPQILFSKHVDILFSLYQIYDVLVSEQYLHIDFFDV